MPWVDEHKCTGCGVCAGECPVEAIVMEDKKAKINMDECIHCGLCHQVCSQNAVRHDSERIGDEVKENLRKTKEFMAECVRYLGEKSEAVKCLNRMKKHFNKEKVVAEKTLEELERLK
jgi:ferredoxin